MTSTFATRTLTSRGSWVPPVDIFETEGHDLVHQGRAAGHDREDIEVTVENNTLTLKGTKKSSDAT